MDGVDKQFMIALNKSTGKTIWQQKRSAKLAQLMFELRKGFSTPLIVNAKSEHPALIISAAQATYGYDPRDGKELWVIHHTGYSNSSRALPYGENVLINTGFNRPELMLVKLNGSGDMTEKQLWKCVKNVPSKPSPVIAGNVLYMVNEGGILTALDVTNGKVLMKERLEGHFSASLLRAGNKIYAFSEEGDCFVFDTNLTLKNMVTSHLEGGYMASPAVVGNDLILRTKWGVYCVREGGVTKVSRK